MKYGIDLDGVIFDTDYVSKMAHDKFALDYEPPADFEFSNYESKVKEAILDMFYDPYIMADNMPLAELQDSIYKHLKQMKDLGHELYIISSRVESVRQRTKTRLNRCFPDLFEDIIFVDKSEDKIEEIQKLEIDIMVDDSPVVIEQCIENDIECILIAHSYNKCLDGKVYSIGTILDL